MAETTQEAPMPEHQDPHWAENDPAATVADELYAALVRTWKEIEDGYMPGIGAHGQAVRAMKRYRDEEGLNGS